jgi:L-ascorbate metabolism protein UlaG (beta-lactamase superfamily)
MKSNLLNVTYIGGPTAILEIDGLRIMTDPTLDPAGSIYHIPNLTVEKTKDPAKVDIGKIDIVLLSHDQHFDNFDNAGRQLVKNVPKTYTTISGAERLKGTSVGLAPWQSDIVLTPEGTEIIVTATPARHGPAGIEKIQGEVTGFILSLKGAMPLEIYIRRRTNERAFFRNNGHQRCNGYGAGFSECHCHSPAL